MARGWVVVAWLLAGAAHGAVIGRTTPAAPLTEVASAMATKLRSNAISSRMPMPLSVIRWVGRTVGDAGPRRIIASYKSH